MRLHTLAVLAVASIAISGLKIGPTRAADEPTTKANANTLRQAAMNNGGNPDRGKKVFLSANAQCAPCHKVHGQGGDVGPDLSQIGGKFDRAHLVESILEPSRQIVEGYRSTVLALRDGRVLTGIVREESAERLTVVDAGGQRRRVVRADT